MDHFVAATVAEKGFDFTGFVAHDAPRVGGRIGRQAPAQFAPVRGLDDHRGAALEIAQSDDLEPILKAIGDAHSVRGLDDVEVAKLDLATNAQNWVAKGEENLLRNIPEVWENAVNLLSSAGMIEGNPDPKSLYTNAALDKAIG